MAEYFDIRTRIPSYGKHAYGKPEPEALYDEINLMCYLLRGLRYGVLYDLTLVEVLDYVQKRVATLPTALANASTRQAAQSRLAQFIFDLNNTVSLNVNFPVITLRDLYERYPAGASVEVDNLIRKAFDDLETVAGMRLCLPFLDRTTRVDPEDMADHINDLGSCDLQDLYELPKRFYSKLGTAAFRDRGNGILVKATVQRAPKKSKRQEGTILFGGGSGGGGANNYRKCVGGVCTDVTTSSYCNPSSDGTCSVSSG